MLNAGCLSEALADTIMARYRHPDVFPYQSWCYSQGFMLWGMIRLWETTHRRSYYDYVMKYLDYHVGPHGELYRFTRESLDDMMAGSVVAWGYGQTGRPELKAACDKIRASFDDYPRLSSGGFYHSRKLHTQMWVDGVFMGNMFLNAYGRYVGDTPYCLSEAIRQLAAIRAVCEKPGTGLLLHAFCEDRSAPWSDPATGCSPEVWSEGLGWYSLILAETLSVIPDGDPRKAQVSGQLRSLIAGLLKTQDQANGLWYQVVDKGERAENWHDTSGSAMFTYTIQKALDLGLLIGEAYESAVKKGYEGILSKAVPDGEGHIDIVDACDGLGVQNTYMDYINFPKSVNAKEAVAAVLWAAGLVEHGEDSCMK